MNQGGRVQALRLPALKELKDVHLKSVRKKKINKIK